jgi:hypothetical protein
MRILRGHAVAYSIRVATSALAALGFSIRKVGGCYPNHLPTFGRALAFLELDDGVRINEGTSYARIGCKSGVQSVVIMNDVTLTQLRFARRQDYSVYKKAHIQVRGGAELMQELTESMNLNRVRITTYSNALGEVGPSAFPTLYDFFHNPDDANHVRVEPLVDF